ncbi:odorant receptor 22a-like [Cydia splendana]|uniref:odorant receptor 22a-like n=1 Tax=Cydia splendana TaxID=1100963 RepID=UPI002131DFDD
MQSLKSRIGIQKTATKEIYTFETNTTVSLFYKICAIVFLGCGTNFMFDDLKLPRKVVEICRIVSKVFALLVLMLVCSACIAFFTQHNLDMMHKSKLWLFGPPLVALNAMQLNCVLRKNQIKKLSYTIAVVLRGMFTVDELEEEMIRKTWRFSLAFAFLLNGLFFSTGIVTGYVASTTNETFTTIVPAWPDLNDHSLAASIARIVHYCVWYMLLMRVCSVYFIILAITIGLQYQFSMMCNYFHSLNSIFAGEDSQEEKQHKYEDAFKFGIKMHSLTLWCIDQTQVTCGVAFSSQFITNLVTLISLMVQFMYMERTFGNCLTVFLYAGVTLTATGIFMWNAGDVTFEATKLRTAMFHSGWHNCRGQASVRVRKLLIIAIRQAQDPVTIKGFGILELSYESYISMVKLAYSVFSVLSQK